MATCSISSTLESGNCRIIVSWKSSPIFIGSIIPYNANYQDKKSWKQTKTQTTNKSGIDEIQIRWARYRFLTKTSQNIFSRNQTSQLLIQRIVGSLIQGAQKSVSWTLASIWAGRDICEQKKYPNERIRMCRVAQRDWRSTGSFFNYVETWKDKVKTGYLKRSQCY